MLTFAISCHPDNSVSQRQRCMCGCRSCIGISMERFICFVPFSYPPWVLLRPTAREGLWSLCNVFQPTPGTSLHQFTNLQQFHILPLARHFMFSDTDFSMKKKMPPYLLKHLSVPRFLQCP